MERIRTNTVISCSGTSVTCSFNGFTVAQAVTFTGLKDYYGISLATSTSNLTFGTGTTVDIMVISASISAGAVIFYN